MKEVPYVVPLEKPTVRGRFVTAFGDLAGVTKKAVTLTSDNDFSCLANLDLATMPCIAAPHELDAALLGMQPR